MILLYKTFCNTDIIYEEQTSCAYTYIIIKMQSIVYIYVREIQTPECNVNLKLKIIQGRVYLCELGRTWWTMDISKVFAHLNAKKHEKCQF